MRMGSITSTFILRYSIFCGFCLLVLLPQPGQAYDFKKCNDCHEADLAGDASRIYLHSPFALEQCGKCHVAEKPESTAVKDKSAASLDLKKINWLADTGMVDTSHVFLLPGDSVRNNLVVDLREADGQFTRQEMTVPSPAGLAEVTDPGKKAVISEVQVLKVERGVFLSATIGWRTDTLTYAQVRYGEQALTQVFKPGTRLGRRHVVVLQSLKPDRTYLFTVVATDLFGRSESTEPMEFSTSNPYQVPTPAASSGNPPQERTEGEVAGSFKRFGKDYLLELSLSHPAAVYVGSNGKARQQSLPETRTVSATSPEEASHKALNSPAMISMKACRTCHNKQSTATHPVNVYPKPGMTVPPEYPTLPDGRITCGSCHISHSSEYEYLSRKRGKRELCVGCHKDML